MPVLDIEKVEYAPPTEGEDFIIVQAEFGKANTDDGEQEKVQIAFEPVERATGDNNIYNEGLWISPTYTPVSKLGSFLVAFEKAFKSGDIEHHKVKKPNYKNFEHWEGAIVRILSWQNRNRKIQVRGYTSTDELTTLQKALDERRSSS